MSTTPLAIITAAFETLNVFTPGESIPNAQAQRALSFLNRMMGSWAQQSLTIPAVSRETFVTTSGKGGPSNPYSIGVGGDLDTTRPPNQASIIGAGLLLASSTPILEIPRAVLTNDAYDAIPFKEQPNTLYTSIYYNPTFANEFGTIHLWPVPTTGDNDLVLYMRKPLSQFAGLTTTYYFPDGYEDALVKNLVRQIAKPWGATVDQDMKDDAVQSLAIIKRANLQMSDLANDFSFIPGRLDHGYNIQTGNL